MQKIIAATVAISALMMGCGGSGGKLTQPTQSSSVTVVSSVASSSIAPGSIASSSVSVSSESLSSIQVSSSSSSVSSEDVSSISSIESSSSEVSSNSSSSSAPLLTGVFLDSAVVNIGYRTQTTVGFTNENGEFSYREGELITFFIGALDLPSVIAKDIITPLDMAEASGSKTNVLMNILRLLQSLDVDGDATNGIQITDEALGAAEWMDLTLPIQTFAQLQDVENLLWASGGVNSQFIPVKQAYDHFQKTLAFINGTASSSSSETSTSSTASSTSVSESSSSSTSSQALPANNILPFIENFNVVSAIQLFAPAYKSLLEPGDDPNPSFYYSTAGLDAGRIVASNGQMTIGNARMTLGQRLQTTGTHINPEALPVDYKVNTTTDALAVSFPATTTWGELDLSHPWKMSFCVKEAEALNGSASNQQFMVYIDNNQSVSSFSIHGIKSLAKQLNVTNFAAGKRVEINFPGEVLIGGQAIDAVLQNLGTTTSFIQLRLPSAAVVTMSELWVGYQSDTTTEPTATSCTAGTREPNWNIAPAPSVPTVPSVESSSNQINVSWEAAARATSYTLAYNTVDSLEGATLVENLTDTSFTITGLANGTTYYVFVSAHNVSGESGFGPSAVVVPEAPVVAPGVPTGLKIYGDNQSALVTWAATDGAQNYSLALNTVNDTATATVVTGITDTFNRLTYLVNNTPYYVFVKAVNSAGESEYTAAQVVIATAPAYIYQANLNLTKDLFFGSNGSAVQTLGAASEIPMHFIAGGGSGITLEEGGIRLASGGRFTIGQVVAPNIDGVLTQTNTAPTDMSVNGVLDLSGYYKIIINVASAPDNMGLFQVFLDNNTTAGANSIHQTTANSRLINRTVSTITDGEEIVYEMNTNHRGTATSFIQLRADSAVGAEGILISGIRIEAMDPP
ncbi:fibronectin type III domain-containing protein [Cellvibrio sp. PSBB023]|uniref:fibronectin type III domain-containing protein n=1 Tax=Cellvibrio sp. PSBB023 TaxID=1945512 RepID=UPI001439E579|nr:fibronectin type III domain-containing protein [Cellvibrio sp. PSBB023]